MKRHLTAITMGLVLLAACAGENEQRGATATSEEQQNSAFR